MDISFKYKYLLDTPNNLHSEMSASGSTNGYDSLDEFMKSIRDDAYDIKITVNDKDGRKELTRKINTLIQDLKDWEQSLESIKKRIRRQADEIMELRIKRGDFH